MYLCVGGVLLISFHSVAWDDVSNTTEDHIQTVSPNAVIITAYLHTTTPCFPLSAFPPQRLVRHYFQLYRDRPIETVFITSLYEYLHGYCSAWRVDVTLSDPTNPTYAELDDILEFCLSIGLDPF